MSKSKKRNRKNGKRMAAIQLLNAVRGNSYAAVKSNNEIYFQMASVFKEITKDEKAAAKKLLGKLLSAKYSKMSGYYFVNSL